MHHPDDILRIDSHHPNRNQALMFESRDGILHRLCSVDNSPAVSAVRVTSRIRLFGFIGQEIIWSKDPFALWVDGRVKVVAQGTDALSIDGQIVSGNIEIKVVESALGIIPIQRLEVGPADRSFVIPIASRVPYLCEYRDIWEADWTDALCRDLQRALPDIHVWQNFENTAGW